MADSQSSAEWNAALMSRQDVWIAACGGSETPFVTRTGVRVLYCYNPALDRHAYVNLDTDIVLTDEEARSVLGVF